MSFSLYTPKGMTAAELASALATALAGLPSGGGGGLTVQEMANALATAPQSAPAAGSLTALTAQQASRQLTSNATGLSLTTNVNGTSYTSFEPALCNTLIVENDTGVDLEYRLGGSTGVVFTLKSGKHQTFATPSNASTVQFRRADQSTTPVTLKGIALFGGHAAPTASMPSDSAGASSGGSIDPVFGPDMFGTITTGGTSQQLLPASGTPRTVSVVNNGMSGQLTMLVGTGDASDTNGVLIHPINNRTVRTAERIAIWGSTTGQSYSYSVSTS